MAFECIAILTDEAKRRTGRNHLWGTAFMAKYFGLSDGGHNPLTPSIALTVDPSSATIPGGTLLYGPEPITDKKQTTDFCPLFICSIPQGEYQGYVSSIGIYAEIVYIDPSDPDPPTLGYQFLYAVCNRPLLALTGLDEPTFNVTVFY
jgi:hypothetical protein